MRLFDLHCDTAYECYTKGWSLFSNPGQVDLERGGFFDAYGQVFAAWISDEKRGEEAWEQCQALLGIIEQAEQKQSDRIAIVRRSGELNQALSTGRCAAVLSVENGAAIGGKQRRISALAQKGVKLLTITWNGENEWGHGVLSPSQKGLKPFGKACVKELERHGIVPDVSHLNERGFWDVAHLCEKPFVATHSLAASVCPHPRNLTDAQFEEIVGRRGLVGLCLAKEHLGEQSMERLERHLYHFWELGGAKTVALGGDMDGTSLPPSWGGLRFWQRFYAYLQKKNYGRALLEALFFENCANFLRSSFDNS